MGHVMIKYRMPCRSHWSRVWIVCGILLLSGCGGGLRLVLDDDHRGVMMYRYKETQGPMLTPRRGEAFQKIRELCRGPFTIVREGETRGRQRMVEGVGGSEIIIENWWGIRFHCGDEIGPP